jgi:peptidoglycan hydrolase-like protein with peptidoglycan-binding domain
VPCGSPGRQLWPVGLFCSPWPEQALRANIHCQISLALNRIYTEWYPSKGYTFNITNSTSYDQYYVHGRTVFDVMVRITDDIFNTYIRKTGTVNPYYSEYCDGKSVTCPGLKQWGTVTLANQGRNALQILKYYYGNDIEIIRTSNIQSIPQSYPGSPIRQGDSGTAVFTLQRQLNRITKDYPFLGLLTVDGVFGAKMAATVRAFQKQFNLTADGVVGRQTWYKISYIYVSVKDLAELTSEGEVSSGTLSDGTWGGTVLRTGSTGSAVEQLQFWLNTLAQYESSIPSLTVDGVYGTGTANTVRAFQRKYGLTVDGVVGRTTWTKVYDGGGIMPDIRTEPEYISRFAMTLYALGFIEDFGDEYVRRHPGQQIDIRTFSITDGDYAEFAEFMKDKEVPYESDTRRALKKLREAAKTDRFEEVEQQIAAIDSTLRDDTATNLETYRKEIVESINNDIVLRHGYSEGVIEHSLPDDGDVLKAIEILGNGQEYARIVTEQDTPRK